MDWSKAKTVLIAALLITNLILCAFFAEEVKARDQAQKDAAEYAVSYARGHGIKVDTALPTDRVRMSVLFVELAEEGSQITRYRGKDVDVYGELGRKVVSGRSGGAEGELIPASTALIILTNRLAGSTGGAITIKEVAPVYRLDATDVEPGATQDTALPAWRFRTDQGDFYVEGFVE